MSEVNCRGCGIAITPKDANESGRPRVWCSTPCRKRAEQRARRQRKAHEWGDRFDIRHLLDLMGEIENRTAGEALGVSHTVVGAWRNGKNHMVTAWVADRCAIRIGTHPAMVWHNWCDMALTYSKDED